ncbi:auxilin-like protein SWA2 NDAI_0C04320 [Naumovozyma dairenensis CBS 421]|uniref:SWA2-like ubiquitin-associated domain-containing protein n=1 Tax=Naumovozyma dairenensis (strain ATCC 10597 / BCRC 20456 / CBS 421 / NBRC 0211 / NRRL Y-12639) TaxID=1071378 RepID=G0W8I1_NAUDC|nr:hypothetical protein NDAI_0C04320 [Naumovozyma dairenensis CBS 421]CCD24092.1 hypothetical protein NDAI_0C04320 [Naumovozyma dairenensis CBS 421]
MSDPFASLLTSFKNGQNTTNNNTTTDTDTKKLSATTPSQSSIQFNLNKASTPSLDTFALAPLIPSSRDASKSNSRVTSPPLIEDDFSDLFNSNEQKNITSPPAPKKDDIDSAFDIFTSTPPLEQQQQQHGLVTEHEKDYEEEIIVDEVKDMEVARLMSLGLSIDQANKYYDKGILYEDIIRKQREKKLKQQSPRNKNNAQDKNNTQKYSDLFDNTYANKRFNESQNNTGNLFSMATDILYKGKELVDQLTAYPEENNRLYKYREPIDNEENPFLQEGSRSPASARSPSLSGSHVASASAKPSSKPSYVERNSLKYEDNNTTLIDDFDYKLTINSKEPSMAKNIPPSITPDTTETNNNNALLDFDGLSTVTAPGSSNISVNKKNTSSSSATSPSPSPASITIATVPISHIELSGHIEFKTRGSELFKNGDYVSALQEYEKSLNTLPQYHPLRIISYSNIIATQLKIGEYSKSIEDCKIALSLFPKGKVTSAWNQIIPDSTPQRSFKDIWSKLIMRQAESYEHLENYKLALDSYQKLIENGFTNSKIMDGKRRCQKILNPPPPPQTSKSPTPTPVSILKHKEKDTTTASVQRLQDENAKSREIENQKVALYDKVESKINAWKLDKDTDIRHLLSNLSTVLTWCDWPSISQADLVMPKKVKITYLKAITKTHPDKIPESLDLENKMIAENVFSILSLAWDKFKLDNNMN